MRTARWPDSGPTHRCTDLHLNSIRGCLLSTGSAHVILEQSRVFDGSTIKAYVQPNQEDHWSDIEVLLQEVGVEMFVAAVPDISAME